jgi:hypothetical protein
VERTLAYQVEIAMVWQLGGQRLPSVDGGGHAVSNAFVARVRVDAGLTEPVALTGQPGFSLLDYRTPATWRAGETQPLVLTWAVYTPFVADYQTYVHLRPEGHGDNTPQADGPPLAGWYPTSWWRAGETVVDDRQFPLPENTPPGDYRLYVGFYDLATGERVGQEFDLGPITVLP